MKTTQIAALVTMAVGVGLCGSAQAAPVVFEGAGAGATTAFDAFTAAIGPTGRRIGWDGVALDGTDANPATQVIDLGNTVAIPENRFRAAGAIFADPYAVSGDGFASVNPATAGQFPAFSPNNTFAMFDASPGQFDDRFIEQSFVLAGTDTPAGTRGFGAIFIDVEDPTSSSIEYFGRTGEGDLVSLGEFFVPVAGDAQPSFLGVLFDNPIVTDVTLTVGTNALFSFDGTTIQSFGPENLAQGIDLAVTDDFLFADPTEAVAVPEPWTLSLLGGGLAGLALMRRRGRR